MGGSFFVDMAKNKIRYNKPPLTLEQQLKQLEDRGMTVMDHGSAIHYLGHLNYYRLAGYCLPFESDHKTHTFKPNTNFDDVVNLYNFDRELRLLIMDAVERIEVSIRTRFAYHLSHKYGPHAHLKPEIFANPLTYSGSALALEETVQRSKEVFIKHLKRKYSDLLPPIWAVVELMTLGSLSKWYQNLKKRSDRKAIADCYDIDESNLQSFLHHLSIVRNICAHHSRLWNRQLTVKFSIPRKRPAPIINSFNMRSPNNIYNTLVMIAWLMDVTSPNNSWKTRLIRLIKEHNIESQQMGFPPDFHTLPIWNNPTNSPIKKK